MVRKWDFLKNLKGYQQADGSKMSNIQLLITWVHDSVKGHFSFLFFISEVIKGDSSSDLKKVTCQDSPKNRWSSSR